MSVLLFTPLGFLLSTNLRLFGIWQWVPKCCFTTG